MAEKKGKLTPFQEEMAKAYKKVLEYKTICEANVVSLLWKNTDFLYSYDRLKLDDFNVNMWKVYWQIAHDVVIKEKKTLDEINVNFYLEKHKKLKEKYLQYGGFDKISQTYEYIKESDMEGYVDELAKWNATIKLIKRKFPIYERINEFVDMKAEDIYDEYEALLNDVFINVEGEVKSYSISEGLDELIDELDEGVAIGMPYNDMDMLNKETGGQYKGSITLVGGLSNVGKSTFVRTTTIPSALKYDEKLIIMLNEDGRKKWQRELMVWVANNIYKEDLQKYTVRDGNYTEETKSLLLKCAQWIRDKDEAGIIRLIPFKKYKTATACKIINKYASMGVNYFILDTFKQDAGKVSANTWLEMQQAMVDINDVVKPESKNVHITVTFQLAKTSARQRFYTQDNIGVAKNIIDPASTCIMVRNLFDDEYSGGKSELKVFRLEGKNGRTEIPVKLDQKKKYQILFVVKNREGEANRYQIVVEHDMSRNMLKEVGICHVPMDF